MQVEQVDMTPAMAKSLLAGNDRNRAPNENRIAVLAAQMKAGKWALNGETVILSETGKLLDGQHRLAAVIVAKKTVPMFLVRGAKDEDLATIDTGKARSNADIVGLQGHRHRVEVAAAAGNLYKLFTGVAMSTVVPPRYILTLLERFPSLDGWADRYKHDKNVQNLVGAGPLIPLLTYLSDVAQRPELAASLFDGIASGQRLSHGDPILALRNRLIRLKGGGEVMNLRACWIGLVRAVDAMEAGQSLERVMFAKTTHKLAPPAKFMEHLERMESNPIDDMPRPDQLPKMRSQKDLMHRLVNK